MALEKTDIEETWVAGIADLSIKFRALVARDTDVALFALMQSAVADVDHYSAHHVMLCAVICEICAIWMEWPEAEIEALVRAALTMNLSMTTVQNVLAKQVAPLSVVQKEVIAAHAGSSADWLVKAGVTDPLWTETVRNHDRDFPREAQLEGAHRLAQLLRRVDVYTAKLSRRASREASSPALAARDACLDSSGLPDAIGATMLRSIGLYPPGSFVELASGELAIVIRRGAKAHMPVVASLQRADGGLLPRPTGRNTSDRAHAVVRGIGAKDVKVSFDAVRVLGC